MIPIKTKPRFRCDFCRFRATRHTVEIHEGRCYKNPNRFCDYCNNKGYTVECHGDLIEEGDCGLSENIVCPYCEKFKKKIKDE